ncbi:MAG: TlpA family protein disulfide reductase [Acidimicrobiia bacterium]|nr:TlpA family protein disulfide reductase [Acidimicrobiia bacterium]
MFRMGLARWAVGVVAVAILAGCGGSDSNATVGPATTPSTNVAAGAGEPVELAEWQQIELTDAEGETFTFADLVGRPVLMETFATWCGNCRRQLGDTNQAAQRAGDDAVFVALSVETDLDPAAMADYADQQGFDDIRFAVMSPEMLAAINDAFGNTALNPPSTPHVAIAVNGGAGEMVTGFDSPEKILSSLGLG